ncbi:MAG: N-acetyltransferase [Candidatus Nanopelagicales bacterium]|jgi:predicted GNAT family acetyltransferase|nr:N-acetyltransferase [Candidatus Nanopelagicales bacterium]
MPTTARDNQPAGRYELLDGEQVAGWIDYHRANGTITLTHTEVDPDHRDQGVARELAMFLLDDARARGLAVLPECPYIRRLIAKEPARFLDLVPADARARFELPEQA